MIKRRLYLTLRTKLTKDWVQYLPLVIDNLNQRHVKSLGGFQPKDDNFLWDDVKIRKAQDAKNVQVYKEPNLDEKKKNQKNYESKKNNPFKPGAYVYLDHKTTAFDKAYEAQISILLNLCFIYLYL